MNVTDELHRLLDERGVEYKDRNIFGKHVFHWGKPFHGAMFTDGGEWTELVVENATPAQAVEATLGSDLQAENAKLRELVQNLTAENEKLQQDLAIREASEQENFIEYLRQENVDWEDRYRALAAENAKLRELLWELFHCSRQVGCDCCETIYRRNCGVLDRIRELGIEVDV